MKRVKVAIVFGNPPDYNSEAFKYFILSINKIQTYYEFCFPDLEYYPFESSVVAFDTCHQTVKTFANQNAIEASHVIAIIASSFDNNFFFDTLAKTSVITTDIWEKHFSPPSLFEYLLHSIYACLFFSQRLPTGTTLNQEQQKIVLDSHSDTRGCIADFTRNKSDDRIDITLGYICEEHTEQILKFYGESYLNEFKHVISRKWIGDINEKESVAYNLKHIFKFDINKDSGFNKTWIEKTKDKISEIPGNAISDFVKILITAILTFLLVKLGLKQ